MRFFASPEMAGLGTCVTCGICGANLGRATKGGPWSLRYSFHFVDAVDPRSRRATTFDDAGDEAAVAPKRLLLQMKVDNAGKGKAQLLGEGRSLMRTWHGDHAYHGGYPRDVNRCCRFGEFGCVKWLIQTGHGVQTG